MSEPAIDLSNAEHKEYWPGPVALEAHRSTAQVKLAWGPLGTAKTTWLCWRAKAIAERAAEAGYSARILFVRDTYRNLIDSTFQTFKEWFPDGSAAGHVSQSEPVDFKLNVPARKGPHKDKARWHDVLFRHGQTEQDASMFLSTEYDSINLEEVAPAYLPGEKKVSPGISEGVFDMAYSRLTRKKERAEAIRPELCMTCNSPPLTHWASKRIIDKPTDYLQKLNWAHWMFPVSDNAHNLRPDYYTNLEMAWEGKRGLIRRFLKGERLPVFIGLPRFNLDQLDELRKRASVPPFRGFLRSTDENMLHVRLEENPEGYVRIWIPPHPHKRYVIGNDVAEGIEGGDNSSGHVLDEEDNIAAAWHGHIEPELFGYELARLGYLYNTAKIGVENNNHGLTTLVALKNVGYPRIYTHRSLELLTKRTEQMGFRTTETSKKLIIDLIGAYLAEIGEGVINDLDLISELSTFGIDEHGKMGAQEGCFDDRVISFGIGRLVNQRDGLERIYPSLGGK